MSGSIYSCHSDTAGQEPRGRPTEQWMQDGWVMQQRGDHMTREPVMKRVRTEFRAMKCGLLPQVGVPADPNCVGCANRIGAEHGA